MKPSGNAPLRPARPASPLNLPGPMPQQKIRQVPLEKFGGKLNQRKAPAIPFRSSRNSSSPVYRQASANSRANPTTTGAIQNTADSTKNKASSEKGSKKLVPNFSRNTMTKRYPVIPGQPATQAAPKPATPTLTEEEKELEYRRKLKVGKEQVLRNMAKFKDEESNAGKKKGLLGRLGVGKKSNEKKLEKPKNSS